MSDCKVTRAELLEAIRGRLSEARRERFDLHLATCPECRKLFERERELTRALEQLPTFTLPDQLRKRLAAQTKRPETQSKPKSRLARWVPMPVADLVTEWFETELLHTALSARALFGNFAGPRSAGTDRAAPASAPWHRRARATSCPCALARWHGRRSRRTARPHSDPLRRWWF